MNVFVVISVLVLGMTVRALAQFVGPSATVLEVIIGTPTLSKIRQLLQSDPQFYTALNNTMRQFTAFLPTDAAMGNMPLQVEELRNHFIDERLDLNGVNTLTPKLSMSDHYLWLQKITGGQLVEFHINGARVINNPEKGQNGLIYSINSILNNLGSVQSLPVAIKQRGQQFSKFSDLLARAQLTQLNSKTAVYTIFVPENIAIYDSLMNCASNQYLTNLLKRHVIPERVLFEPMLLHNLTVPALNGGIRSVYIPSNKSYTLQSDSAPAEMTAAIVTQYGYPAANGVMHVINRLLHVGPNVLDYLQNPLISAAISTFMDKLNQLDPLKSSMCNRDSQQLYTLFVFTNAAFNGLTSDEQTLQGDDLRKLMERHILETSMRLMHIGVERKPYTTKSGDTVNVIQETGEYYVEHAGIKAKLRNEVITDNGVVYFIDKVLIGAAPSLSATSSLTYSLIILIFTYLC